VNSREIEEREGELQEIKEAAAKDKKKRRAACKTIDDLVKFAQDENYAQPHAYAAKWWSIRNQWRNK